MQLCDLESNYVKHAIKDLERMKTMSGIRDYSMAYFFAQQGLEKLLKAFIQTNVSEHLDVTSYQSLMKSHNLKILVKACSKIVPDLKSANREILSLATSYYYESRYPSSTEYSYDYEVLDIFEEEYNHLTQELEFIMDKLEDYLNEMQPTSEF